jgi:hypothetical protein
MTGGFFHHTEAQRFGLNEEAEAYLYTEAMVHQIYALAVLYRLALLGKGKWATPEFFFKSVGKGLAEHERESELAPGSVSSFVFKRLMDMGNLSPEQTRDGEHFNQSVALVREYDPSADKSAIHVALQKASEEYFSHARKMFGI